MAKNESRTVWSSEQGDLRTQQTPGRHMKSLSPHEQTVYLHRDSKGRGGKTVTLVKKLVLSDEDVRELANKLKRVRGSGGTVKEAVIEIQVEHREKIREVLVRMGYKVEIAGG